MSEWNTAYERLLDINAAISDDSTNIELKNVEGQDQKSLLPSTMTPEERYQHAAIYIDEGERYSKFKYHPIGKKALKAYKAVNGPLVNVIDLMASLLLLVLALFEAPSVIKLPPWVTGDIEILLLICLLPHSFFYYNWKGQGVLKEKKMIVKHFLIVEMLIEALVVIIRESPHLRFMRAFRPVFLFTNRYTNGMKRVLTEILESMPPVIDVLILLFFFVTTLSVVGFYWFSEGHSNNTYTHDLKNWYFEDLAGSWINLFILTTTANYPDVMMPAYQKYSYAPLFFIFFLLFGLYFIGNLILAAIYNNFTKKENEKFSRLYYHKRRGLRLAFEVVDQDGQGKMNFETFRGIMSAYNRWKTRDTMIVVFCALDKDEKGYLTLEDWFKLERIITCSWKQDIGEASGLLCGRNRYPHQLKPFLKMLRKVVNSKFFEYFMDAAIVVNSALIIATAASIEYAEDGSPLFGGLKVAYLY
jgi:two pore calcium channel protein 1